MTETRRKEIHSMNKATMEITLVNSERTNEALRKEIEEQESAITDTISNNLETEEARDTVRLLEIFDHKVANYCGEYGEQYMRSLSNILSGRSSGWNSTEKTGQENSNHGRSLGYV